MSLSSQLLEQYEQEFIDRCRKVEDGELSPIEAAVYFKKEMDCLSRLAEERKTWLNENVDAITDEAEQYGKSGFRGFLFSKQYRETLSFKHIASWIKVESEKKAIEHQSKLALKMIQSGGLNVDENGEEIPLPEIKTSSFIKIDKIK